MSGTLPIVAIGQLPPPMSGFAYITDQMIAALRATHAVVVCNIAAPVAATGARKHLFRLARTVAACLTLLFSARGAGRVCYIACEGGLGLVYTLLVITTARVAGYKIFLHHHSFAYIDRPRSLMRAVLRLGGDTTHIFLCAIMRDRFETAYRRIVRSTVLSNAAFVPTDTPPEPRPDATLVLGHLSNLTREKGLYLFLDLLRQSIGAKLDVRGVLAGPAALAEDRAAIAAAVVEFSGLLDYRGPVYGADKARFYRDIDVFVFPTQYANEAQPTVIFEAQAAGCWVVAYDRGCIAPQVEANGIVVAPDADFVTATMAWMSSSTPISDRSERHTRFASRRAEALAVLARLLQPATTPVQIEERV